MLIYVPLNQIDDNPFQERQDYTDVGELAGRIAAKLRDYPDTFGLMQVPRGRAFWNGEVAADNQFEKKVAAPGKVLKLDAPDVRVQLAFGHRRARAFRYLQTTETVHINGKDVPVPEVYKDGLFPIHIDALTDDQMLDAVWSENRERKDISAVEEARLLARKLERVRATGGSQRDVADEWGLARPTVANRLRLLELPEEIQVANQDGRLSERQCLALSRVIKIQDITNGSGAVDWAGHMPDHNYGNPPAPDVYIGHVIGQGEDISSDDIRRMTNRMLQHAGETLPGVIADCDCSDMPPKSGFERVPDGQLGGCKGCPSRINDTCLRPDCLTVKAAWYGVKTARTAAAEMGLHYSDVDTDFDPFYKQDLRMKLRAYYEAGHRDNLVIGWRPAGSLVRPFHNSDWVYVGELYDGDGRRGVVIGHKTGVLSDVDESGKAAPPPDIADQATLKEWKKRSGQLLTRCRRIARQAVKECLADDISDFRVIMALVQSANTETTDDQEELLTAFTKWIWERGYWAVGSQSDDAVKEIETIAAMLDRSGITRAVLELSLADRAVLWLDYWYAAREWKWSTHKHLASWQAISALRDEFEAAGLPAGEMLVLGLELDRAARDIRAMLGDKLKAVETAVSEGTNA